MQKSHSFTQLSSRVCAHPGCKKHIKQRLVSSESNKDQNKKFNLCYKHFRMTKQTERPA